MPTDALPPIPTPPAQRWREFRIQVLPVIMFVCLLGMLTFMWRNFVQPAGIVGEVQPIRANVSSLMDGVLAELTVDSFEPVVKAQILGHVVVMGENLSRASIDAARTELMLQLQQFNSDKTRNISDITRLKSQLAQHKIDLALAEVELDFATQEYERAKRLKAEGLIPDSSADANTFTYQVALRDKNKWGNTVQVLRLAVTDIEKDFKQLVDQGLVTVDNNDKSIDAAIKAQTDLIKAESEPQQLRSPIDGRVSTIWKRAGEKVVRGEPLVTISSPTSDRVIGYIRQPVNIIPTTNDLVQVRTRSQKRQIADCKILHVGPSMEPINPAMMPPDNQRIEVGLPILVALPPEFRLIPGEFVDVTITSAKK